MLKNNPNHPPAFKYEDQDILNDIKYVCETYKTTSLKEYRKYGKYSDSAITNHFGNWTMALKILDIEPNRHHFVTKEELDADVRSVIEKTGSTKRENYLQHGKYSRQIVKNHYKTWNNLLKMLGYKINMYKPGQYTKEDIMQDYLDLSLKNGALLGSADYRLIGKYSQPIIDGTFGSFTEFKAELKEKYYNEYKQLFDKEIVSSLHCERIRAFASDVLKSYCYTEYTFDWLKNDKTDAFMYIDIYFPEYNLAIEVDGGQHYRYVDFIHRSYDNFLEQQYRDRLKDKLLFEHDIQLIRVRPYFGKKDEQKLYSLLHKMWCDKNQDSDN